MADSFKEATQWLTKRAIEYNKIMISIKQRKTMYHIKEWEIKYIKYCELTCVALIFGHTNQLRR